MVKEIIKIGISSCLLGNKTRYDGGHKHDRYINDTLGQYFEFVPVCPEVECGLPVPRETMQLEGDPENPRLVTTMTQLDHTERMKSWAAKRIRELEKKNLHGFIFKCRSPSCGIKEVKVSGEDGKSVIGMFAQAVMDHFPHLPVIDEESMHDPVQRENFIQILSKLNEEP